MCHKKLVLRESEKEREREKIINLSLSPLKEEFSLYQKLWDSEKVDKSDTKLFYDLIFIKKVSYLIL